MEINYIELFRKYKKFIIPVVILATVISIVIVYRMPLFYRATTKIYVSDYENIRATYAFLKSQEMLDRIDERFNLVNEFKVKNSDRARDKFLDNIQFVFDSRFNIIEIKVKWTNEEMASEIANAFVEELQRSYFSPALSQLSSQRIQYENHLRDAELELTNIQNNPPQGFAANERLKEIIKQIAELRADIVFGENILISQKATSTEMALADFYLGVLKDVKRDNNKLNLLENELSNYLNKANLPQGEVEKYLYLKELTAYLSELKDAEFKIVLYKNLIDKTKLEETSHNILDLQVIEKAVPPTEPAGPARTKIIIFTAFISLVLVVFLSLLIEYLKSTRQKHLHLSSLPGLKEGR